MESKTRLVVAGMYLLVLCRAFYMTLVNTSRPQTKARIRDSNIYFPANHLRYVCVVKYTYFHHFPSNGDGREDQLSTELQEVIITEDK